MRARITHDVPVTPDATVALPSPWWRPRLPVVDKARLARMVGWVLVGASGLVVNTLALWMFAGTVGIHYLFAAALSTQISSTWNFLFVDTLVFRGPKKSTRWRRLIGFLLAGNLVLLARIPVLALLVDLAGLHYLLANLLTLAASFLGRFLVQERLSIPEEAL